MWKPRRRSACGASDAAQPPFRIGRRAPSRATAGFAAALVANSLISAAAVPEPDPISLGRHRPRGALAIALQAQAAGSERDVPDRRHGQVFSCVCLVPLILGGASADRTLWPA